MQIIDSNGFCVRIVNYLLAKDNIEFLVIPVGSEDYYKEISLELDKCDKILFESLRLDALKGLSKAYRLFAHRLSLVYQGDMMDSKIYKDKLIHADLGKEEAEKEWNKISLLSRLTFKTSLLVGLPLLSYFLDKQFFADYLKDTDDFDDKFWFAEENFTKGIAEFILFKREAILFQKIDLQLAKNQRNKTRIGIIYGAGHVSRIIDYLMKKQSFKIENAWFATAFWLSEHKFEYKNQEE